MKLKFDFDGIDEVSRELGSAKASRLEDAIELDIAQGTRKMAVAAAKETPVDTGALRASILSSPAREGEMTFYWGTRLPYGLRQEYEHEPRKGWMRRAFREGKVSLHDDLSKTTRRLLGG